jgi:hypothetical protein
MISGKLLGRYYLMNKKTIYQVMNGEISLEAVVIPDELQLEDEFEEGKECCRLYDEIYEAKKRLLNRLGGGRGYGY